VPEQRVAGLDFSVVIALSEVRGDTVNYIRSWSRGQTYPRNRYEVIVVSDGSRPELDRTIEAVLGEQDVLLHQPPATEPALYHHGAEYAAGTFLFMTECHVQAKADCLERMRDFLASNAVDGARCHTIGLGIEDWGTAMGWRLIQEGLRPAERLSSWRNFVLHGVAISRDTYFQEGGLDDRFGLFAYSAFGAKLESHGKQLAYSPGSTVYHLGCSAQDDTTRITDDIVRGEVRFRAEHEAEVGERYFGAPPEWLARASYRREVARPLVGAILRALPGALVRGRLARSMGWARALARLLPSAISGARFSLWRVRLAERIAAGRRSILRWKSERSYAAYTEYSHQYMRYARLKAISDHLARLGQDEPEANRYELGTIDQDRAIGFYPPVADAGFPFRWLGPAALLEVSLSPGRYEVRVEIAETANEERAHLAMYFDGHRLRRAADGTLAFQLDPETFSASASHTLVLLSNCRPPGPSRKRSRAPSLGIRAIEFEAVGGLETASLLVGREDLLV
jgi:hypothetical protein